MALFEVGRTKRMHHAILVNQTMDYIHVFVANNGELIVPQVITQKVGDHLGSLLSAIPNPCVKKSVCCAVIRQVA